MDIVTYALCKRYAQKSITDAVSDLTSSTIPHIGSNGNWFIGDTDTGVRVEHNVEVDGTLKANTEEQNIVVIKDGSTTVVGNATYSIEKEKIDSLF